MLRGEFVVAAGAKHESYERADMARAHSLPSSPPIEAHHRLGMAMLAAWLLWQHRLVLGLATGFIPSAVVTILLTQFTDLDRIKRSTLGRYVAVRITHAMVATRLAGLVIFWVGAQH